MANVFLSYAHSDQGAAEALATALAKYGWSVFWDRTIPVGKTWDRVLEAELTAAGCIIVLWSSASASSEWVRVEAAIGRKILIPVLLEDRVTIPLRFRALQAARLVDWKDRLEGSPSFEPLIRAIEELTGAPRGAALVKPAARRQSYDVRDPRSIYLGYANESSGPAHRIRQYLAKSGVAVLDWAMEFRPGSTILEELEQATKHCKGAIFLFTKDDALVTRGSSRTVLGNLTFELGFFVHAVGRHRVAILLERGVTLPADMAGLVFFELPDASDISTVLSKLKDWTGSLTR